MELLLLLNRRVRGKESEDVGQAVAGRGKGGAKAAGQVRAVATRSFSN